VFFDTASDYLAIERKPAQAGVLGIVAAVCEHQIPARGKVRRENWRLGNLFSLSGLLQSQLLPHLVRTLAVNRKP
jgi:hypothetical protein